MLSDEEKALTETEIRFRADLIILNSEFPTHRKTEAMEELLEIYNKQSKEIEELKKNKGYHLGFIDGGIAKKYEIQDKIKAKIEELEKGNKNTFIRGEKILVLQSLLEKE